MKGDLDIGQLVVEDAHYLRQPVGFLPGQKAECKSRFGGFGCPPRCFSSGLDLTQR
jgi:hypothetical protein